jgi:hypothetical protein
MTSLTPAILTRALLLLIATTCCTAGLAQEPPDPAPAAEEASAETSVAGPDADEQTADELPQDEAPEEITENVSEDPGALIEEDPAIAASAEEEFDPDEEISEDYPVPLPSDI